MKTEVANDAMMLASLQSQLEEKDLDLQAMQEVANTRAQEAFGHLRERKRAEGLVARLSAEIEMLRSANANDAAATAQETVAAPEVAKTPKTKKFDPAKAKGVKPAPKPLTPTAVMPPAPTKDE